MSCYFLSNEGKCNVLKKRNCVGCNFRKTKSEVMEGRIKALKRLNQTRKKHYFIEKYYNGVTPSHKEEE